MSVVHLVSGSTPTFRIWVSQRSQGGDPEGNPHEGETGLADADIKVYAAAPGSSLPGSPISDTHYSWTERGRGHYDIAFSEASYFTGSGPQAISIEFDDGVYVYPVGEIFYRVESVPAEVRSMANNVVTNAAIANNAISNVKFDTGAIDDLVLASDCITASKIANNAIDRATFAQDAKDLFGELRRGTAQSGTTSTIVLDAFASAVDDFYNSALLVIVSGTGAGQFRTVSDYVGSTKTVTPSSNFTTAPDNTSVFVLIAMPITAVGSTVNANVVSMATDAISAAAVSSAAADKIGLANWAQIGEGAHTYGDLARGQVAAFVAPATDFRTGTITIKSLNGAKTRWIITTDDSGRLTCTPVDLTA